MRTARSSPPPAPCRSCDPAQSRLRDGESKPHSFGVMIMSTTDLVIGGMTCASCASRVEKKLNKLDGVKAMVNLATETAHVSFPDAVTVADLIAVVERTGYTATRPAPAIAGPDAAAGPADSG